MTCKLMYIPNDDSQNYLSAEWLKRWDTQLNEQTNDQVSKVTNE